MSKAREQLSAFKVDTQGPYDIAVMLLNYMRHTPDTEHEQTIAVFTLLNRWKQAIEAEATPLLTAKTLRLSEALKKALEEVGRIAEDLGSAEAITRDDVREVRRGKT